MIENDVHGYAEVVWDHASIPDRVWKKLTRLPNGCWVAENGAVARRVSPTILERTLHVNPEADVWTMAPTCADIRCCNPAHTCVIWATPLSKELAWER